MPSQLHFRDRREMQLFAEQVLQYRFPDKNFQSFGYHQPHLEDQRKVYTLTDNTLYYFLPDVTPEAVHSAIGDVETLLQRDPFMEANGAAKAIKSAVLVGELGESVQHDTAIEATISRYKGPLDLGMSYIDEDLYWDIRRDQLEPENGTKTPVTEILSAIQKRPAAVSTIDRPRYLNRPIVDTTPTQIPTAETIAQSPTNGNVAVAEPAPKVEVIDHPSDERRSSREDVERERERHDIGHLGWLDGVNSLALLAGVILLGGLLSWLLMRWLPQLGNLWNTQPTNTAVSPLVPVPPAPPPGTNQTTTNTNTKTTQVTTATTNQNQTTQPVPKAYVWQVQTPAGYNAINLRERPSGRSGIIGSVRTGNKLIDAGEDAGNWRKVQYGNRLGWVYRGYIR